MPSHDQTSDKPQSYLRTDVLPFLSRRPDSFFVWLEQVAYNGKSPCGIISDERKRKELVDLSWAVSRTTKSRRAVILHEVISFLSSTLHSFYLPLSAVVPTISPPLLSSEKGRRLALPTWAKSSKSRSAISFGTTVDRTMRYKRALGMTCSFHRQYRSRETSTIFGVDDEPWSPGGKIRESREIFTRA